MQLLNDLIYQVIGTRDWKALKEDNRLQRNSVDYDLSLATVGIQMDAEFNVKVHGRIYLQVAYMANPGDGLQYHVDFLNKGFPLKCMFERYPWF